MIERVPQPGTEQSRLRVSAVLAPVLVGLAAFTVSAVGSWIPNLWGDEAASLLSAQRSLPSLWTMINHVDAVHAGYYVLLHGWISVFGDSPFSIRFPSALAVGAAAAGIVVLVRFFSRTWFAVLAGLACAVLPRMTYAGEEARSYAMTATIAVWLTVILVAAMRRDRHGDRLWIAYGVLLALGTQLFLYLALIPAAHAMAMAMLRPARAFWRVWLKTSLIAGAFALPFVVLAASEHSQISFLADRNDSTLPVVLPNAFFAEGLVMYVGWGLSLVTIVAFVVRRIRRTAWTPIDRLTAIVLPWAFAPFILLEALNALIPAFTSRYLTMCAPAVAVVIVLGVREIVLLVQRATTRMRWPAALAAGAATVLLVALVVPAWADQRTPYAKNNSDWSQISDTIGASAHPGDAIIFDETVRPSRKTRLAMHAYPAGFANVTDVGLSKPYYEVANWADATLPIAKVISSGRLDGFTRVWVVEYATGGTVDTYGLAALEAAGFRRTESVREHSSVIYLYERAAGGSEATPAP
ncbi:glycosyltransferase family 39 protein [Microbacterium sp. ASV49]|uniref:Glycosyltransferase family 39 protein n=1 Tax=Microbacterium candidum TaxID=3041922 RepID=A0ABT7MVL9_9MICO|nr:glycosyltransferase family 39 protein [Microbacterium sp. ASV49]MDL9978502.1 glycosyltransferase family 39 protein [Microbacterium sp. ASV49]